MSAVPEVPWEGQCSNAAYDFGLRCAVLATENPYEEVVPLDRIINTLINQAHQNRNFSQTEIRAAFDKAARDMPRYTAGKERRSTTSTTLATADGGPRKSNRSGRRGAPKSS